MNTKNTGEPVLHLDGVTKKYGSTLALKNVNLSVGGSRIVGLFGPNGCGKTTMLKLISGLLVPNAGRIRVGGYEAGSA